MTCQSLSCSLWLPNFKRTFMTAKLWLDTVSTTLSHWQKAIYSSVYRSHSVILIGSKGLARGVSTWCLGVFWMHFFQFGHRFGHPKILFFIIFWIGSGCLDLVNFGILGNFGQPILNFWLSPWLRGIWIKYHIKRISTTGMYYSVLLDLNGKHWFCCCLLSHAFPTIMLAECVSGWMEINMRYWVLFEKSVMTVFCLVTIETKWYN